MYDNDKVIEISTLFAAIKMIASIQSIIGQDQDTNNRNIIKPVNSIMQRMKTVRDKSIKLIESNIGTQINNVQFNKLTELALEQACFEFEQQSDSTSLNYLVLTDGEMETLIKSFTTYFKKYETVGYSDSNCLSLNENIIIQYTNLFTKIFTHFIKNFNIEGDHREKISSYIQSGCSDIVLEILKEIDYKGSSIIFNEYISCFGKLYLACIDETFRQYYEEYTENENSLDSISFPDDTIGDFANRVISNENKALKDPDFIFNEVHENFLIKRELIRNQIQILFSKLKDEK